MKTKVAKEILVVDDQENWRNLLRKLLQQEDYNVQTAIDFNSAEKMILDKEFDLLILDLRLIDQETFNVQGLELLKLAKSLKNSPATIIFTGYPESIKEGVLETIGVDKLMFKVPPGDKFKGQKFKLAVRELLT